MSISRNLIGVFLILVSVCFGRCSADNQVKIADNVDLIGVEVLKDSTWVENTHFHLDNKCLHTVGHYIYCCDTVLISVTGGE